MKDLLVCALIIHGECYTEKFRNFRPREIFSVKFVLCCFVNFLRFLEVCCLFLNQCLKIKIEDVPDALTSINPNLDEEDFQFVSHVSNHLHFLENHVFQDGVSS